MFRSYVKKKEGKKGRKKELKKQNITSVNQNKSQLKNTNKHTVTFVSHFINVFVIILGFKKQEAWVNRIATMHCQTVKQQIEGAVPKQELQKVF